MGRISGYGTKEEINEKIREATEYINAIVLSIKERGGMEHLAYEEVKSLLEEDIPEFIQYIESIEQYVHAEFSETDLFNELTETKPVLKELHDAVCMLKHKIEIGK